MSGEFQKRFRDSLAASGMSVAELARRSGVSYHAIDKLKKRDGATTSVENATKLALALGIDSNQTESVNLMLSIFVRLSPAQQSAIISVAEAMLKTN